MTSEKNYNQMNLLEKVEYYMEMGYSEEFALNEIASENGYNDESED